MSVLRICRRAAPASRRLVAVLGAVIVSCGLWQGVSEAAPRPAHPAPRHPVPRTSGQALAELRAYNQEFERVTEAYNDARVLLAKRQGELRVAGERVLAAQTEYAALDSQRRHVVRSSYQSVPFGHINALLTATSPQDYVDRLDVLGTIATRRARVLEQATLIQSAASRARSIAQAAARSAAKLAADLSVRRTDLARRAAESRALFRTLSARERAAFLAAQAVRAAQAAAAARVAERASRGSPRYGPWVAGPASGRAAIAVAWAVRELGKPYIWAAEGPGAFDCSGLTMFVWAKAGVSLPHSSRIQSTMGGQVPRSALRPGDLVFFGDPVHHVGIYVGSGVMINAPQSNDVVRYASINWPDYAGARRVG